MPNTLKRFEDVFKISTMCLRFNRSHPDILRTKTWKFCSCLILTCCFLDFYFLCYSIITHDIKVGDLTEACKNISMVIVFFNVSFKYITLLVRQESIKGFIKFVENDYAESDNDCEENKSIVLHYAEKGVNVCRFWFVSFFAVSCIFPLKAFVAMGYYYWKGNFKLVSLFELTYPEPIESYKNIPILFWLLFALVYSFNIYATSMYIGFDPLVPIFLLHVCGQINILIRRLETLFTEFKDPKELEDQLRKIIMKQQNLYKFVDSIKSYSSILYECNIKATTFLIPLSAFQIIEDLRNHWINIEFVAVFVASILHFFLPSYYSDLLMEKSQDFREAIYSSGWQKCPDKRVRQTILLMLTRARTPMGIRTVFYDINLDTFANMCHQSYAIFSLLNAVWR